MSDPPPPPPERKKLGHLLAKKNFTPLPELDLEDVRRRFNDRIARRRRPATANGRPSPQVAVDPRATSASPRSTIDNIIAEIAGGGTLQQNPSSSSSTTPQQEETEEIIVNGRVIHYQVSPTGPKNVQVSAVLPVRSTLRPPSPDIQEVETVIHRPGSIFDPNRPRSPPRNRVVNATGKVNERASIPPFKQTTTMVPVKKATDGPEVLITETPRLVVGNDGGLFTTNRFSPFGLPMADDDARSEENVTSSSSSSRVLRSASRCPPSTAPSSVPMMHPLPLCPIIGPSDPSPSPSASETQDKVVAAAANVDRIVVAHLSEAKGPDNPAESNGPPPTEEDQQADQNVKETPPTPPGPSGSGAKVQASNASTTPPDSNVSLDMRTCGFCYAKFTTLEELTCHLQQEAFIDKNRRVLAPEDKESLQQWLRRKFRPVQTEEYCELCDTRVRNWKLHLTTYHPDRMNGKPLNYADKSRSLGGGKFRCPMCSKSVHACDMSKHIIEKHPLPLCVYCGVQFVDAGDVHQHNLRHLSNAREYQQVLTDQARKTEQERIAVEKLKFAPTTVAFSFQQTQCVFCLGKFPKHIAHHHYDFHMAEFQREKNSNILVPPYAQDPKKKGGCKSCVRQEERRGEFFHYLDVHLLEKHFVKCPLCNLTVEKADLTAHYQRCTKYCETTPDLSEERRTVLWTDYLRWLDGGWKLLSDVSIAKCDICNGFALDGKARTAHIDHHISLFTAKKAMFTVDRVTLLVTCPWCSKKLIYPWAHPHFAHHHVAGVMPIVERPYTCSFCKAEFQNGVAFDHHLLADVNALRTCESFDVRGHPADKLSDLQRSAVFKLPELSWPEVTDVLVECAYCHVSVEMRNMRTHADFHVAIMKAEPETVTWAKPQLTDRNRLKCPFATICGRAACSFSNEEQLFHHVQSKISPVIKFRIYNTTPTSKQRCVFCDTWQGRPMKGMTKAGLYQHYEAVHFFTNLKQLEERSAKNSYGVGLRRTYFTICKVIDDPKVCPLCNEAEFSDGGALTAHFRTCHNYDLTTQEPIIDFNEKWKNWTPTDASSSAPPPPPPPPTEGVLDRSFESSKGEEDADVLLDAAGDPIEEGQPLYFPDAPETMLECEICNESLPEKDILLHKAFFHNVVESATLQIELQSSRHRNYLVVSDAVKQLAEYVERTNRHHQQYFRLFNHHLWLAQSFELRRNLSSRVDSIRIKRNNKAKYTPSDVVKAKIEAAEATVQLYSAIEHYKSGQAVQLPEEVIKGKRYKGGKKVVLKQAAKKTTQEFAALRYKDTTFEDHIPQTHTIASIVPQSYSTPGLVGSLRKYDAGEVEKCKTRMNDFLAKCSDNDAAFADGFDRPLHWPEGLFSVEGSKGEEADSYGEGGSVVLPLSALKADVSSLVRPAKDDTIIAVPNSEIKIRTTEVYLQWVKGVAQRKGTVVSAELICERETRLKADEFITVEEIISLYCDDADIIMTEVTNDRGELDYDMLYRRKPALRKVKQGYEASFFKSHRRAAPTDSSKIADFAWEIFTQRCKSSKADFHVGEENSGQVPMPIVLKSRSLNFFVPGQTAFNFDRNSSGNFLSLFPLEHPSLSRRMLASIAFLPGTALGGWATWPLDMAKSYVTQGQAVTFVVPRSGASKLVESFRGVFTDAYVECPSAHRHEKFVMDPRLIRSGGIAVFQSAYKDYDLHVFAEGTSSLTIAAGLCFQMTGGYLSRAHLFYGLPEDLCGVDCEFALQTENIIDMAKRCMLTSLSTVDFSLYCAECHLTFKKTEQLDNHKAKHHGLCSRAVAEVDDGKLDPQIFDTDAIRKLTAEDSEEEESDEEGAEKKKKRKKEEKTPRPQANKRTRSSSANKGKRKTDGNVSEGDQPLSKIAKAAASSQDEEEDDQAEEEPAKTPKRRSTAIKLVPRQPSARKKRQTKADLEEDSDDESTPRPPPKKRCPKCRGIFNYPHELNNHGCDLIHMCTDCAFIAETADLLKAHNELVHPEH